MNVSNSILIRFWSKVSKTSHCWNWIGLKNNGYGTFGCKGKTYLAHRFSYEISKGSIPKGLEIDHLCSNRSCVNPSHLEAVSHKENLLRADTFQSRNSKKTHCNNGHPLSGSNLVKYDLKRGIRACKICYNLRMNNYYHLSVKVIKL